MIYPLLNWSLRQFGDMKFDVSGDARLMPLSFLLSKKQISKFANPRLLDERLSQIDDQRRIKRVFVMGCGRSGTWLLTALMATFKDTCVVAKEVPVELFAKLTTTGATLVLKRNNESFRTLQQIPVGIQIAYAIRHPYAVLTSNNPTSDRTYHISVDRWLAEMAALRLLLESGRPGVRIVRYEDLVADPASVQMELANAFGLSISSPPTNLTNVFKPSRRAEAAMHGARSIDTRSVNKYRSDATKIDYLKKIRPRVESMLDWVAERFEYDLGLADV